MARKLTQKQENFCQEYVKTGNASEAYRRAYNASRMKANTIHIKASELMSSGNVSVRIKELQEKAEERTMITIEKVVKELAKIGFMDPKKLFDENNKLKNISAIEDEAAAAITEVVVNRRYIGEGEEEEVVKYKMASKQSALDMLMRHLGGYERDNRQKTNDVIVVKAPEWGDDQD